MDKPAPLILTLALDDPSFAFFDEQRRRYFPPERNFISAHITLFHALPGEHADEISRDIAARSLSCRPFPVQVTGLRSLGRGVAYTLASAELDTLRKDLARAWDSRLGPQDRQKHQPHVTVQNKVDPEAAKDLLSRLAAAFMPFAAMAVGLDLWWYRGGPWEKAQSFPFASSTAGTD
jgi:2'-5' RNA ligase